MPSASKVIDCFHRILSTITIVKPETAIRWHRRGFGPTGGGSLAGAVDAHESTVRSETEQAKP